MGFDGMSLTNILGNGLAAMHAGTASGGGDLPLPAVALVVSPAILTPTKNIGAGSEISPEKIAQPLDSQGEPRKHPLVSPIETTIDRLKKHWVALDRETQDDTKIGCVSLDQ